MTPDALASASAIILILSLAALALLRVLSSGKDTTRKGGSHGEDKGDVDGHELKVVILYGTQTGTSERFAKEVEEELLQRYDKAVRVQTSDLEAVTSDRAEDVLLEGSMGDARVLHVFSSPHTETVSRLMLLQNLCTGPVILLTMVACQIFSNRSRTVCLDWGTAHTSTTAAAKLVDKSLHSLGASRLLELHLGDDDSTLEDDFQGWREALWNAMETTYGICAEGNLSSGGEARSYHVSTVSKLDAVAAERLECEAMSKRPTSSLTSQSSPCAASIILAKELHSKVSERSCVHVEFDISGTGISYQHGDHLGVFAKNMFPVVQRAATSLKLPLDHSFTLSMPDDAPASLTQPFPTPCTLGTALSRYADLLNPPPENCSRCSGICRNRRR